MLQREAELIYKKPIERYIPKVSKQQNTIIINHKNLICEILSDIHNNIPVPIIAWKFHKWICDSIISVLKQLHFKKLVLSGGCFQNMLLCNMLTESLKKSHCEFYFNTIVPPNDGGISLGQAFFKENKHVPCSTG